jgi:hypothetical protein
LATEFLVKYLDKRQWKEEEAGGNYTVKSFEFRVSYRLTLIKQFRISDSDVIR